MSDEAPSVEIPTVPTAATPALACADVCLIRLAGEQLAAETGQTADLQPAYVGAGHMWAGATADVINSLQAQGLVANVIAAHAETLRLYVVRAPAEMTVQKRDELVRGFGAVAYSRRTVRSRAVRAVLLQEAFQSRVFDP